MATARDTVERLRARLSGEVADPELCAVADKLSLRLRLTCEDAGIDILFPERRIVEPGGEPDIEIAADPDAWAALTRPLPPPGFQSFTALQLANPAFTVEGDPLLIAQARATLERLTELLHEPAPAIPSARIERNLAQIEGRYVALPSGGEALEIYFESAGEGVPLVMLHTAGADSRQFQALLSDVDLARRFRLIAFDLPFHGRSFPPAAWSGDAYCLTQETYARWVADCIGAIAGAPVILMGCSMGAAISLVIAARHPDLLKGAIALEPPLRARGRRSAYLAHPAVNAGQHNQAYVRSLMSPASPAQGRRRAAWIYTQAGPGIYAGDLAFYSDEFDAETVAPLIDTARCPTTLMTGEYDYSASPEDGARIAGMIPGARFVRMERLGHFPMTENPDLFRTYLMPVLETLN
jgi:pimeloyl-ACP methyl ester carboxylesterase